MKLSSKKYTFSHLIVGTLILFIGVFWVYNNFHDYYYWNFTTGWRCGFGQPSNSLLFVEMGLGLVNIALSISVIRNRLKPFLAVLFQLLILGVGIGLYFLLNPYV